MCEVLERWITIKSSVVFSFRGVSLPQLSLSDFLVGGEHVSRCWEELLLSLLSVRGGGCLQSSNDLNVKERERGLPDRLKNYKGLLFNRTGKDQMPL